MRKVNKKLLVTLPILFLVIGVVLVVSNKALLNSIMPTQEGSTITYPKVEVYTPGDPNALFSVTQITTEEVTLDYVLKIPDYTSSKLTLDGTKACLEDGKCSPNWCELAAGKSCLPNGFFLRNNSSSTVKYKLAPSADIRIINSRQIETLITITPTDMLDQFTKDPQFRNRVYSLRLVEDVIYSMTEMYNP